MQKTLYICTLLLLYAPFVWSQTCCTAGAPTSTSLEVNSNANNAFSVQLGYEYKSINLLIDNNQRIENDPRSRAGQNVSLKTDYILNDKWSFSAFIPLVYQTRSTFSESQNSLGLGDLSLVTQYALYSGETNNVSLSFGAKLPTAHTNHRGSSQILLSPDMQSGSGSMDYLFRVAYQRSQFLSPNLTGFSSLVYRKNGVNDSFGATDSFEGRRFGFGDELNLILGFSYLHVESSGFFVPDLSLKIRHAEANIEQEVTAPNSGGFWFSVPVGFSFVPAEHISIRVFSEIPVYQDLEGLQISNNFTAGVQFQYSFKKRNTN